MFLSLQALGSKAYTVNRIEGGKALWVVEFPAKTEFKGSVQNFSSVDEPHLLAVGMIEARIPLDHLGKAQSQGLNCNIRNECDDPLD